MIYVLLWIVLGIISCVFICAAWEHTPKKNTYHPYDEVDEWDGFGFFLFLTFACVPLAILCLVFFGLKNWFEGKPIITVTPQFKNYWNTSKKARQERKNEIKRNRRNKLQVWDNDLDNTSYQFDPHKEGYYK